MSGAVLLRVYALMVSSGTFFLPFTVSTVSIDNHTIDTVSLQLLSDTATGISPSMNTVQFLRGMWCVHCRLKHRFVSLPFIAVTIWLFS